MSGVVGQIEWHESAEELHARYRREQDGGLRTRVQALWLIRTGRREQDGGLRTRVQALWLIRTGRTEQEAATVAGVGRRTLTRWLAWYRAGGLPEVLRRVPGHGSRGAASRLTPAQQAALLARCATGAFHTYAEAQRWVEHEFGVSYRYAGIYDLLARMQVHPKVPRPTAAKADPAAQAAWKKGALPLR